MRNHFLIFCMLGISLCASSQDDNILLHETFDKTEGEDLPKGFMVLNGDFTIRELDGNRALFLPGEPLSDFSVMFGPSERDGIEIAASIRSGRQKRIFPRFGVGLCGINGYKLFLTPSKRALELIKRSDTVQQVAYRWKPDEWVLFRLQVAAEGDAWIVRGKAWPKSSDEPEEWMVTYKEESQPSKGKASIWGTPYSGKDIWFDDLSVTKIP